MKAVTLSVHGGPEALEYRDVPDPTPLTPKLSYPPSVVAEIAVAVHEAGARLAVHVMGDNVGLALDAGADSIEHGTLASEDEIRAMAARRVALVPTLSTVAGRYLEPMGAEPILDRARAALPLAAELGVPLLAGTDEEPPGTLADEAAWMVRYGVPPAVAVAGATDVARAFLGLPGLEDGAPADLVTFDADPCADLSALARPVAVVAGGQRRRRRSRSGRQRRSGRRVHSATIRPRRQVPVTERTASVHNTTRRRLGGRIVVLCTRTGRDSPFIVAVRRGPRRAPAQRSPKKSALSPYWNSRKGIARSTALT